MKTFILVFISCQLWQLQVISKPVEESSTSGRKPRKSENDYPVTLPQRGPMRRRFYPARLAEKHATANVTKKTTATTTTRVALDDDCDYVNYYCMRGFYTGQVCGRTVYQTYETFRSYCELEYINCLEQYDMWTIAHMGECYNVSSFRVFGYYADAIWDNEQLEEMYVMPA